MEKYIFIKMHSKVNSELILSLKEFDKYEENYVDFDEIGKLFLQVENSDNKKELMRVIISKIDLFSEEIKDSITMSQVIKNNDEILTLL